MRVSVPKLALIGLGVAGAMKLSVELLPMAAFAAGAETEAAAPADLPVTPAVYDATAPGESGMCEPTHLVADAIAEERKLLEDQRKAVADREARLALAEESLKAEQGRLSKVRDEIAAQLAVIEGANAQDMTKLVALYRNMKPQVAAGIMDEIDIETAVEVIGAMPERDAAQIMGSFSLVRARAITKILLERSKLPADRNLDGLKLR
jgi:flagellar motility protein MotE (MotC chaperone)